MDAAHVLLENEQWLRTVVYSRLGDRVATEDVLQEVLVAAVTSSKQAEIREIRGWLYQVAVRQVLLFRRKEARHRKKLKQVAMEVRTAMPATGVEQVCSQEEATQVQLAMQQIKPSDRQVLILKYSDDLSCRQIAERLGVSESTIQSRLLRARRKLRSILIQQGDFEEYSNESRRT